jgi:hypothetical protein
VIVYPSELIHDGPPEIWNPFTPYACAISPLNGKFSVLNIPGPRLPNMLLGPPTLGLIEATSNCGRASCALKIPAIAAIRTIARRNCPLMAYYVPSSIV